MRAPTNPTISTNFGLADDLVAAAEADANLYNRRRRHARRCVAITGADAVLDHLRRRLDDALAAVDPAVGAVALTATLAHLTPELNR